MMVSLRIEWHGSADGSMWSNTCQGLDFIRITPGCSIEVATRAGGKGDRYTYHSSVFLCTNSDSPHKCEVRPTPGCDEVRSVRLFKTPVSLRSDLLRGLVNSGPAGPKKDTLYGFSILLM